MKPTIGEQLRKAREERGITLKEAAKITHIRLHYLQELESDHPELLPSYVHARGFLRLYASFLELSPQSLIEQWDEKLHEDEVLPEKEEKEEEEKEEEKEEKIVPLVEKVSGFLRRIFKRKEQKQKAALEEGAQQPVQEMSQEELPTEEEGPPRVEELAEQAAPIEQQSMPDDDEKLSAVDERSSQEIFTEIGTALRTRREGLGLALADIERFTRLKRIYLQAIEEGHFDKLPSTVQGRGMLNNYAKFLSMDNEAVMSLYADALQTLRLERMAPRKKDSELSSRFGVNIPQRWRRYISPDLVMGGALIIALFVFIFWGAAQIFGGGEQQPIEVPSISEVLQYTPTLSPVAGLEGTMEITPEPGEEATQAAGGVPVQPDAPTPIATVNAAPLQLYIIAHQRTWMRITVDGRVVFEGRTVPENAYTYSGDEQIDLLIGNGSALEVYFNQDFLGELGEVGEVVNISFTLEGMNVQIPTVTATPKPTATTEIPQEGDENVY